MSTPLRGTHLIDLATSSISYDRQVQSACKAFDQQMFSIIDETGQVIMIPNIMNIKSETLVDILAWQFHVDFYDASRDFDFRKRLVQMSILWHMTKGTVALVQEVLDTYWPGGASLEEWFQYRDPFPPNYPIDGADIMWLTFAPSDVNFATDKFNKTAHGLTNGTQIRFQGTFAFGSTLPAPLIAGVWYFVITATTNSFQVSASEGGPPVNLTNAGVGTNQIWKRGAGTWHDRYKFRILVDEEIITPSDYAAVLALIDQYKPVSRWCEGVFRVFVSECSIGWAGAMLRFIYRTSEAPDYP